MTSTSFGARLEEQFRSGKRLCVGIDPHSYLLQQWQLPDTAEGAREFSFRVLDAALGKAAAVKPQVAFFERFGAEGYRVLEELLRAAKHADLLLIADVKRSDVGSSFSAYADAWLQPGSPLEADAMTVSPFQGFDALDAALAYSSDSAKGVFVLAATSNPEAAVVQQSRTITGSTLSAHILEQLDMFNDRAVRSGRVANAGAVLGATIDLRDFEINVADVNGDKLTHAVMPILAPGFGHQGGEIEQAQAQFGKYFGGLLVSESRSLVDGGAALVNERITKRCDQLAPLFVGAI